MFGWNVNPTYSVNMVALARRPGRSACVATASTVLLSAPSHSTPDSKTHQAFCNDCVHAAYIVTEGEVMRWRGGLDVLRVLTIARG